MDGCSGEGAEGVPGGVHGVLDVVGGPVDDGGHRFVRYESRVMATASSTGVVLAPKARRKRLPSTTNGISNW